MKDYLLSFSILGLVLGFYSALVIVQSRPVRAVAHNSHVAGSITSELTENSTEPTSTTPSIEMNQKITR